jgi:D-3-phosphoglycerate dehydrogenase
MQIVILDDYQDAVRQLDCFGQLSGHTVSIYRDPPADLDQLVARLADAEALVLIRERTSITSALLDRLPRLRLISQTGKISNHLDLAACTAHGVAVAEGVGSPVAPAELAWALILAASRRLPQYCAELQAGRWQSSRGLGLGRALSGLTLGIWGYGKIGRMIAGYGRAFGMQVLVWGRPPSLAAAALDGYGTASDQAALFRQSDVLSLHLRLNEATRGCVGLADLARMKPDALFVNISRAELVAAGALEQALAGGRPGFAALDVYESEPIITPEHPLLRLPNVVCTPHLGYVEQASYERYFASAFANILAFASGSPQNLANPEV